MLFRMYICRCARSSAPLPRFHAATPCHLVTCISLGHGVPGTTPGPPRAGPRLPGIGLTKLTTKHSGTRTVGSSRSRDVARGGTWCKHKSWRGCRCGPLSCLDHPHPRAPCAILAIQPLARSGPRRRRRRAEMLVRGDVRCDCERYEMLIENRSTTVDAQCPMSSSQLL